MSRWLGVAGSCLLGALGQFSDDLMSVRELSRLLGGHLTNVSQNRPHNLDTSIPYMGLGGAKYLVRAVCE